MFWNGTRWVPGEPPPRAGRASTSRLTAWIATLIMVLGLATPAIPAIVAAASHHAPSSGCSISPSDTTVGAAYTVSAWGIPTRTAVNLWVTEDGTTVGRPLGSTPDGTFNLQESSSTSGVTTYEFTGPVKKHMAVYGTCSVTAS